MIQHRLSLYRKLITISSNWLAYLYGQANPKPRPDVMPKRRKGIMRAAGFGFTRIDTQAS